MYDINLNFDNAEEIIRKTFKRDSPRISPMGIQPPPREKANGEPTNEHDHDGKIKNHEPNLLLFKTEDSMGHLVYDDEENMILIKNDPETKNICYLGWQDNSCCGIEIEEDVNSFITGEFQGCFFYLSVNNGKIVIMHSNWVKDRGGLGSFTKKANARRFLQAFYNSSQIEIEIEYNRDLNGSAGWILGLRKNKSNQWKLLYIITEKTNWTWLWPNYIKNLGTYTF